MGVHQDPENQENFAVIDMKVPDNIQAEGRKIHNETVEKSRKSANSWDCTVIKKPFQGGSPGSKQQK